jgi:cytochrome o ubiquinol oxidase subunit 3
VTDAVITAGQDEDTEAEEAERAIDEKAYGFWIYLMSDAIIFALLFATFVVMSHNTADGPSGHTLFRLPHTFAETMLLLASSATFGFAIVAIAAGQRWRTLAWLSVTFLLGLGFVAMKISELYGMAVAGAGPWRSGFLSAFFTLVGTHGLHVTFGLVWIVPGMRGRVARAEPIRRLPPLPARPVLAFPGILSGLTSSPSFTCRGFSNMPAPPQLSKMPTSPHGGEVTIKPYLVGVVLALVLTAIHSASPPLARCGRYRFCRHRRCGDHSGRRPPAVFSAPRLETVVAEQTDRAVLRRHRAPHSGRRHPMDHVRPQLSHDVGGGR